MTNPPPPPSEPDPASRTQPDPIPEPGRARGPASEPEPEAAPQLGPRPEPTPGPEDGPTAQPTGAAGAETGAAPGAQSEPGPEVGAADGTTEAPGGPAARRMASRADVIAGFHRGLDGPTWRVAGWGSAELQRLRFEALVRAAGYLGGTVLDWGCGPADLYFFLRTLNLPLRYVGVDADPRMVELARRRGAPNVELLEVDAVPRHVADYVFLSGVFQFQDPDDPLYYLRTLEQGYDISRRAVAANFLSAQRDPAARAADELYADPAVLVRFAAAVTDRWVLDHGYHPDAGDFTIALLK